jgi:hypothetical protein
MHRLRAPVFGQQGQQVEGLVAGGAVALVVAGDGGGAGVSGGHAVADVGHALGGIGQVEDLAARAPLAGLGEKPRHRVEALVDVLFAAGHAAAIQRVAQPGHVAHGGGHAVEPDLAGLDLGGGDEVAEAAQARADAADGDGAQAAIHAGGL